MARGGQRFDPFYGSLSFFVIVIVFLLYKRCARNILLAVGSTLVLYAGLNGNITNAMVIGGFIALLVYFLSRKTMEGFEDAEENTDEEEEVVVQPKPVKKTEAFASKKGKAPPPDHGDRAEFFELGKKYKMPSEEDDKDFHLDAGTTFLNAYKSLKPEQITAMTKDTQELMETQKQLMSTLHTLKPLITDGKQMMEMFQTYFGSSAPTAV